MSRHLRQSGGSDRAPARSVPVSLCGHPGLWRIPKSSIHVVTAENRTLYQDSLEASFRLRHHVYVKERGWEAFRKRDEREIDAYDTEDTVYLFVLEDGSRRLIGCTRLLPTVKARPLREFTGLTGDYDLPRSPSIYHFSRCIVASERRGGIAVNALTMFLRAGVQEFCLAEEIEQLSILMPVALLPVYLELGWNPQPLGLPEILWGASCVVATLDVSEVALAKMRRVGGIAGSVLIRRGITRPIVPSAAISKHLC